MLFAVVMGGDGRVDGGGALGASCCDVVIEVDVGGSDADAGVIFSASEFATAAANPIRLIPSWIIVIIFVSSFFSSLTLVTFIVGTGGVGGATLQGLAIDFVCVAFNPMIDDALK